MSHPNKEEKIKEDNSGPTRRKGPEILSIPGKVRQGLGAHRRGVNGVGKGRGSAYQSFVSTVSFPSCLISPSCIFRIYDPHMCRNNLM